MVFLGPVRGGFERCAHSMIRAPLPWIKSLSCSILRLIKSIYLHTLTDWIACEAFPNYREKVSTQPRTIKGKLIIGGYTKCRV